MINRPRAMSLLSSFSTRDTRLAISRRRMKILCLAPHAHPGDGLLDIVFVSAGEQDKLGMCLSDCIDGKLARPALTVRKGQQLQVEWDGFTVHIDDEVWPDKGSAFPLSPNLIDITVRRHALQFLVTP